MDSPNIEIYNMSRVQAWHSCVKFDNPQAVTSSISKAMNFLDEHTDPITGLHNKYIGNSRHNLNTESDFPRDRFTTLMALDLLNDSAPLKLVKKWRQSVAFSPDSSNLTLNYFYDNDTYVLPDDVDTTSVYYLGNLQKVSRKTLQTVAKLVLQNVSPETGIIQTYFPPRDEHFTTDACANANCMRLLYIAELGENATATEDDLYRHLCLQQYLQGTRYYSSPDTFLYCLSRVVAVSPRAKSRFAQPLLKAIKSRMGTTSRTMDSAQRILAHYYIGVLSSNNSSKLLTVDINNVLNKQDIDGGWETDSLAKFGRREIYQGGREITTVFALAALLAYERMIQ